jgi:nuclear pore complex protein Nup107
MSQSAEPDDGDDERSENEDDVFQDDEGMRLELYGIMGTHCTADEQQPAFALNSSTAFDLLQPLQQTADRVSRQVEDFARVLDRFNADREPSDQGLWEDARKVFQQLSTISENRLGEATTRDGRANFSSRNRRSLGDTEAEIQRLESEANLWALTSDLLICSSPEQLMSARASQESVLNGIHRYSLPAEIWNAFLDADTTAQEYETILDWLQKTADISSTDIEKVLTDLNAKAERGDGIWSAGHLYTKNAIKAQKRTISLPKPLDSTISGITVSHVRPMDSEPLVSQMDPDAQTREGRVLLQQDDFHEQYAWRACWELLRRGKTQQQTQEWWAARKEVWRAVCLRANSNRPEQQSPVFTRIMNIASNRKWYEVCRQLCQNDTDLYTYQSAVYGILAGDLASTLRVCQTIDDGLFAHFNALLIGRYKLFLSAWNTKIEDASKSIYTPMTAKWDPVRLYLAACQADDLTKVESHEPHKTIQAAIVSHDFEAFFVRTGQAAAQIAHLTHDNAHLIAKDEESPRDEGAQNTAGDFDSVRMVAHLQLVLRSLGYLDEVYCKHLYTVENNIANYIGWLQRENKFELIPLYASQLSKDRISNVLGAILIDVTEPKDRDRQVKLMKKYNIDIPDVLWGIFCIPNNPMIEKLQKRGLRDNFASITEYVGPGRVKNLKIRPHFMSSDVRDADMVAISSVEWFRYTDVKSWARACWAIGALYMTFFTEGRLAAASALAERASLSEMSLAALNMNLNIAEASDDDMDVDTFAQEDSHKPISPTRKRKQSAPNLLLLPGTSREQLASKSLVWVQLEQLITVLNAFDRWSDTEAVLEEYVANLPTKFNRWLTSNRNRTNPTQMRSSKRELKKYLEAIQELMYPLLEKGYLCRPNEEAERIVLDDIRNHYLPECILAYDSVLFYAGHALSRSYLVECMNLAQIVASNPTLTNAFVESKRMQELVTAFALDSKALLHANELDNGKKAKKDNGIDIWQIKGLKLNDPAELEALD